MSSYKGFCITVCSNLSVRWYKVTKEKKRVIARAKVPEDVQDHLLAQLQPLYPEKVAKLSPRLSDGAKGRGLMKGGSISPTSSKPVKVKRIGGKTCSELSYPIENPVPPYYFADAGEILEVLACMGITSISASLGEKALYNVYLKFQKALPEIERSRKAIKEEERRKKEEEEKKKAERIANAERTTAAERRRWRELHGLPPD